MGLCELLSDGGGIVFRTKFCGLVAMEVVVVYFGCGYFGLVVVVVVVVDFWSEFCGLVVVL